MVIYSNVAAFDVSSICMFWESVNTTNLGFKPASPRAKANVLKNINTNEKTQIRIIYCYKQHVAY